MKACVPPLILACAIAPFASADNVVAPAPSTGGATVIYRQVLPTGRIVYSDKPIKGARLDETLTMQAPIKGNLWTTESSARPDIPPQTERTLVRRLNAIPVPGQKKTLADADSEVIRAEMLLEDAKRRRAAGVEPLPGERSGTVSGKSRLNETYEKRQRLLAIDVDEAETTLRQAIAERDAFLHTR